MWVIRKNNVGWDCFKTPILREILKIQNLLRMEHCAFLEVIHLFQSVGCVRNKLPFHTVQQNQKSFLWMQDWGWMVFTLLTFGIWSLQFLETRIRNVWNRTTCQRTNVKFVLHLTRFTNASNLIEWPMSWIMLIFIPSNVQSSHQEALLYVFEDNEAVIKMIMKGRSPTMRYVSRPHRVALDWLFNRINLDSKIQIKFIDTKNQLADKVTKGNFTRDEWNHLLCLFNISHFSSTDCSEVMTKRTKKDANEERVTAKSKPMMNFVSRCSVRNPNVLLSSASESPGKNRHESPFPLNPQTEQHYRTGRSVVYAYSSNYSEWNVDKPWSSQERKSDKLMEDRTGRPGCTRTAHGQIHCWKRKDEFLHRSRIRNVVKIQIILAQGEWLSEIKAEPILKRYNERQRQTFCDMENVYVFNIASICIHGEELTQTICIPSTIQKISQWNRCSTNLKNWYSNNQTRSME